MTDVIWIINSLSNLSSELVTCAWQGQKLLWKIQFFTVPGEAALTNSISLSAGASSRLCIPQAEPEPSVSLISLICQKSQVVWSGFAWGEWPRWTYGSCSLCYQTPVCLQLHWDDRGWTDAVQIFPLHLSSVKPACLSTSNLNSCTD